MDGIDRETASTRLERTDRARLAYHQTLYCADPRKPELYHLVVDSTALPFETCVELIARVTPRTVSARRPSRRRSTSCQGSSSSSCRR